MGVGGAVIYADGQGRVCVRLADLDSRLRPHIRCSGWSCSIEAVGISDGRTVTVVEWYVPLDDVYAALLAWQLSTRVPRGRVHW